VQVSNSSEAKTKKDLDIEKGHHSFDIISNNEILEFHIDYWEQSKAPPFCQRQLHQQPAHDREIRHYRSKPNSWHNLIGTIAPAHSSTVFSKQIRAANAGGSNNFNWQDIVGSLINSLKVEVINFIPSRGCSRATSHFSHHAESASCCPPTKALHSSFLSSTTDR
jgi:hypothetical protein